MLVYGSPEVIRALSSFYDTPDGTRDEEGREKFANLVRAMRKDGNIKDYENLARDVDNILLSGPERRREVIASDLKSGKRESI